jgi:hypothetical protein
MRGIKTGVVLPAMAAILAEVPGHQAAEKTVLTGIETFDPFNILGGGIIGQIISPMR